MSASRGGAQRPWRVGTGEYITDVGDVDEVNDEGSHSKPRLNSASALKTHVTLVGGLAICAAAFWFELRRAEGGNELSWAYVFEWPLLGLFAIYMWWKLLHPEFRLRRAAKKPAIAPEYEGMLAAWQDEVRRLETTQRDDAEGEGEIPPAHPGGRGASEP